MYISFVGLTLDCLVHTSGVYSFQQNIQELAVIKQFKLPITIFLFNNNGYCSIKNTQKNYFNKRYIGTGPYSNLLFPDLKKISEAYKIKYLRIMPIKLLWFKLPCVSIHSYKYFPGI